MPLAQSSTATISTSRLAWGAWLLGISALALLIAGLLLGLLNGVEWLSLLYLVAVVSSLLVGSVVGSQCPANPVGWFFLASGVCYAGMFFASEYARYGLFTHPGRLPFDYTAAWLSRLLIIPGIGFILGLMPLYYPNGHLLSPRWRPALWLAVLFQILGLIWFAIRPGEIEGFPGVINPLRVEVLHPMVELLDAATIGMWLIVVLLAAASIVMRLRRSTGDERQQMKWLAYMVVTWFIIVLISTVLAGATGPVVFWIEVLLSLAFAGIPLAAGVAVMRYRLYDIDILINRTLVYGALTAMLALLYFGSVVLFQSLFRTLASHSSQLAIVASTLAIAVLFNPLHQRIQAFIDRRFYRRKYDAQKTLAAFATTVRNEVELERLTGELLLVIEETLQPAHISLWLRSEAPPHSENRQLSEPLS
ncbi:MAG: hypothetical protein M3220_00495 [Chloroflexota bacterium]|nr:hypothetical protein [Chloroflexota bacterium]